MVCHAMPSMVRLTEMPGLKPVPRIWTLVPGGPLEGDSVKVEVMVKFPAKTLPTLTSY
jgi:hypothetical protein